MPELNEAAPAAAAREAALAAIAAVEVTPTTLVGYASAGRVLVIGPREAAEAAAARLAEPLRAAVVFDGDVRARQEAGRLVLGLPRGRYGIEGYLGAFQLEGDADSLGELLKERFDLVLDLFAEPVNQAPFPPPGYYATRGGREALEAALAGLPEMVGEFEKPKFFDYDPAICAHGRSGIQACTRCLDTCPADAISSLLDLERIEVDPHLCQGKGICASVCPTGAIRYLYPSLKDQLERVRHGLRAFREAGGRDPVLLLHVDSVAPEAPAANVIPFPLEGLPSVGIEFWLTALAYGARGVWLYRHATMPARVADGLDEQRRFAAALLAGLGGSAEAIAWVGPGDAALASGRREGLMPELAPATFGGLGGKRTVLFMAIDHLTQALGAPADPVALPAGAPLGRIHVDPERCTLCMGCVGVCPAKALSDGGDQPQLLFYEQNCVQCGLCEQACPERAITREARLLPDPAVRGQKTLLHEEAVFHCVRCGKPFATQKMIDRITAKLAGHHMFQDAESIRRLQMCDDCRVRDMFEGRRQLS